MKKYLTVFFLTISSLTFAQSLYVNEILATNKGIFKDQFGNADDCIEIYNANAYNLDISGYYLTDTKDSLTLWKFPEGTTIKANSYLVVWADNELGEPGLHANFKLNSKGETVRLVDPKGKEIHKLKYKRQFKDISYGLLPDGSDTKSYMNPTMGKKNVVGKVLGHSTKSKKEKIKVRTNSDKTAFIILNNTGAKVKVIIRNKEDQVFFRGMVEEEKGFIYIEDLEPGRYEMQVGKNLYRIVKA